MCLQTYVNTKASATASAQQEQARCAPRASTGVGLGHAEPHVKRRGDRSEVSICLSSSH